MTNKEILEQIANSREEGTPEEEAKNLNIFTKALTAFVRFVKWTVIDTITKAVVLGVAAAKAGFNWIVSVGRK